MKSDLVDIEVELIHATEKAWLITADGDKKIWIPKSRAELERILGKRTYTLTLAENFAIEKELL